MHLWPARARRQITLTKDSVVAPVCDAIYSKNTGGGELRYHALIPRLAERVDMHALHYALGGRPERCALNSVSA